MNKNNRLAPKILIFTITTLINLCLFNNIKAQWVQESNLYTTVTEMHWFSQTQAMLSTTDGIMKYDNGAWTNITYTMFPKVGWMNSMSFISENEGWAAGLGGSILYYDGITWLHTESPTSLDLNSIQFINSDYGWAVGDNGVILKYYSGNWHVFSVNVFSDLRRVYFINENQGFIVTSLGVVLKYDGTSFYSDNTFQQYSITGIEFHDNHFYAYGYKIASDQSVLLISNDGNSWSEIYLSSNSNPIQDIAVSMSYINSNSIWLLTNSSLLHFDGTNWSIVCPAPCYYANNEMSLKIFNDNTGWIIQNQFFSFNGKSRSIYYFPPININASPSGIFVNILLRDIFLIDKVNGWCVGIDYINGHISSSFAFFDGKNWKAHSKFQDIDINALSFGNKNNGWAVGNDGKVLHYNGNEWQLFNTGISIALNDIEMIGENNGWIVGKNGLLLKYNGIGWGVVYTGTTENLTSIDFNDKGDGWILGDNNVILKYDGSTWNSLTNTAGKTFLDVASISATKAWFSDNKSVYEYDAGKWNQTTLSQNGLLTKISFSDEKHGWCIGDQTNIFAYSDGIWKEQYKEDNGICLLSIFPLDSLNVWTCGNEASLILYTNNGGGDNSTIGIADYNKTNKESLLIYPNPSITNITIEYELETPGNSYINIYNQLGQQVDILVNEFHQKGKYKVEWQTDGFQSGIYYCTFKTGTKLYSGIIILTK